MTGGPNSPNTATVVTSAQWQDLGLNVMFSVLLVLGAMKKSRDSLKLEGVNPMFSKRLPGSSVRRVLPKQLLNAGKK